MKTIYTTTGIAFYIFARVLILVGRFGKGADRVANKLFDKGGR